VLDDLAFETGSVTLEGEYASLRALSDFLSASPGTTIALVGHTDAEGGAEGNIALSRRRAEAARKLLIERHGADPARIETHGVGFFAPLGPNDTEAGRAANRRVEAVITSTE
jgi:OOP family OmpA-OmpF porin